MTKLPLTSIAGIAALCFAVAAPWLLTSYDLNLLGRFLALSLTAMGLVLLWGEGGVLSLGQGVFRSEEHTSELQSLMRISYAVFCLTKKNNVTHPHTSCNH